jgi:AcrR family transcriptional regulator
MTREDMGPRARAAETKKRRTREKLIHAADRVMREDGLDATVEAIALDAQVSVPNFYNYYTSRNELCVEAFEVLVLDQLELADINNFAATCRMLMRLCKDRGSLTRAAVVGIMEVEDGKTASDKSEPEDDAAAEPDSPVRHPNLWIHINPGTDLLSRLAYLFVDDELERQTIRQTGTTQEVDTIAAERITVALVTLAWVFLSLVAPDDPPDGADEDDVLLHLRNIVRMAAGLPPESPLNARETEPVREITAAETWVAESADPEPPAWFGGPESGPKSPWR